jgi:hypothetical protein
VLKNEIENYGCGFVLKIRTRENGDTLRLDISYVKEIRIVVVVVGPPRVTEGEEKQKKISLCLTLLKSLARVTPKFVGHHFWCRLF